MTLEELAARKCAELSNARGSGWLSVDFTGRCNDSQTAFREYVEAIHLAIIAYEAGDKTALDPFRLVEPVDPLESAITHAGRSSGVLNDGQFAHHVRAALKESGYEIVEIGRAERG